MDPKTGMVRDDRKYSAHRDTVVNRCNAFGNSMVALLAMTLVDLGWDVPDAIGEYQRLVPRAEDALAVDRRLFLTRDADLVQ